jgi:hypothetical protein
VRAWGDGIRREKALLELFNLFIQSVNLFFILAMTKDELTDLWGN